MTDPRPTIIIDVVAEVYEVPASVILGATRSAWAVRPRQVAMALTVELLSLSTTQVGRLFDRDHSTVVHAITVVGNRQAGEASFRELYAEIHRRAQERLGAVKAIAMACDTLKYALIDRVKGDPAGAVAAICAALSVTPQQLEASPWASANT